MKVLFLDIDGVLNSGRYFGVRSKRAYRRERGTRKANLGDERFAEMIDPEAVILLNEITKRTGCKFVISSSWRGAWTCVEIVAMLGSRGFVGEVIGATPLEVVPPSGFAPARGFEIQTWLDEHPEVKAFAIVDDVSDMAHLLPRLVQTSTADGFQAEHVELVVALLGELPDADRFER